MVSHVLFICCLDDCSRKVASKWSERKRTVDVLDVLEEWIVINGKPRKVMRDNGKQFTSKIFKRFLEHNDIKDKPIPKSYPQLQGKVEAYNKIVKNEKEEEYYKNTRHNRKKLIDEWLTICEYNQQKINDIMLDTANEDSQDGTEEEDYSVRSVISGLISHGLGNLIITPQRQNVYIYKSLKDMVAI
jgi:Integrase core domain